MTVVELVVTLALLAIVVAIFSTAMISMFTAVHVADRRSQSNDSVRLAIEELDRQVRSGNVIHVPSGGVSLRLFTQTNAPTATAENRCVEWRVDGGRLETRSWSRDYPAPGSWVTDWRIVTDNLRNEVSGTPAFSFDTEQAGFGNRIVKVTFVVNRDERAGSNVEITASLTGRNVQFGHPLTLCDTVPGVTS